MRFWIGVMLLVACGSGGKDWRRAKKAGTADAYRVIANQPLHPKRAKAAVRTERLDWEQAEAKGTAAGWKAYRSHQPNAPRAADARVRERAARWQEVQDADDRSSYETFLNTNPPAVQAIEARRRIDELAWDEVTTLNTAEGYGVYVVRHADGVHAGEASRRRMALLWDEAVGIDSADAYAGYLRRFPDSEHAFDARKILDGFKYDGVVVQVVTSTTIRKDSLNSYNDALRRGLGSIGVPVRFNPPFRRNQRPSTWDPVSGADHLSKPGHGILMVLVSEERGEAFQPSGFETRLRASVHLVAPGRSDALQSTDLTVATSDTVVAFEDRDLHVDAQVQLGRAIARAFDLKAWKR